MGKTNDPGYSNLTQDVLRSRERKRPNRRQDPRTNKQLLHWRYSVRTGGKSSGKPITSIESTQSKIEKTAGGKTSNNSHTSKIA